VVQEWVEVMRRIWTREVADYAGEFVTLAPSRAWPKPVQQPHPPILLGCPPSERSWQRIATWCDGWITMGQPVTDLAFELAVRRLREVWTSAGRDPQGPRLDVIHNPVPGAPPMDVAVARARELGAERFLCHVFEGDRDQMLRRLDRAATALSPGAAG
jgi:alkanesulfonate monooxygenase SsuD/methylene tetrahydromethanopterin reductase-like flavin-dependent oxidoreductase (luciferase family)